MSEVRVNKLSPRSGTTVTLGDSGDTITIPSGVTFDASSGGLAGTLTTAAQPNITQTGTLTSFTSTGIDDNATSTAITIDSSERVGIGESVPSLGKLVITTTQSFQPLIGLRTEVSNGEVGIQFVSDNATPGINYLNFGDSADVNSGQIAYRHNVDAMTFKTNDSERMRIDSSGNVGIGTSSPEEALHIKSTTNAKPEILIETVNDGANGGRLDFLHKSASPADGDLLGDITFGGYSDSGTPPSDFARYVMMKAYAEDVSDGAEKGRLTFSIHSGSGNENNVDVLTLNGTNVGIGTSSPNSFAKLHIVDGAGTLPTMATGDVLTIQNNNDTSDNAGLTAISGTSGISYVQFGDSADKNEGAVYYYNSDDSMRFLANASERMRIDSSGQVSIGSTSTNARLFCESDNSLVSTFRLNDTSAGSTSRNIAIFQRRGTNVGFIGVTDSSTSFITSSDYRLKENVSYDFDATTRLKQLKPARFNFIADADTTVDGFLAHEVSSIVPEAISGEKDKTETKEKVVVNANGNVIAENIEQADWETGKIADENGNTQYPTDSTWEATKVVPVYQGIDQSKLVPLLVKTIQELEARITALENQP